ncbi:type II secretion system protein N [Candidatus Albibeggiatoa sp. nov. NOAA]|uniref:type II secretion system protein N n=1 Tax=Candidatus Albibeggiatoa sp. nov. NOAA TaxID=3162724 RepID=UPI0032FBDFF4|nr:hypothetical protein [Thiotrichaceae bacterium]
MYSQKVSDNSTKHLSISNTPNIIVNSPPHAQFDVQPIINAHLFGQIQQKNPQKKPINNTLPNQDIPETKLKINLQGIYYSDNQNHSFVIIDDKKVRLNTAIRVGVLLYQIHPKKIVLQRNNRFESLMLRETQPLHSQAVKAKNKPNKQPPEQLLATYQRQLKANPQSLAQLARIQPAYNNGQLVGYRLSEGKDKTLLAQFNLQAGDILTTVNDVELDSPLKGLSLIQQLSEAEQLNVTVLRHGRPYSQSFNIKN